MRDMIPIANDRLSQQVAFLVEADKLKADFGVEEKKAATVKESIARQTADLEAKSKTLQSRLEELTKERAEIAGKIDEDLLGRFERLFKSKGDAVVVALEHEVCTGCHMKITTQTAVRVKGGKEIVSCEQCGRILYAA